MGGDSLDKQQNSAKRGKLFRSSLIISAVGKASSWIYKKLENGFIGGIFTAYSRENDALEKSALMEFKNKLDISGRVFVPIKRKFAHGAENSMILGFIGRWLHGLLSSSIKSYGIFLFSFTLYSTVAYLFRTFYINGGKNIDLSVAVTLALMLVSSVLMIASRHTLSSALLTSPASRFLMFKVMGVRREEVETDNVSEGRFNIPFIVGLLFGIVSAFVHPLYMLVGIGLLIGAFIVLMKPEVGLLAVLLTLPFVPTMVLVAVILYTSLCYFIKVLCGKRSLKFDLLDGAVLVFMVLMLVGGVVSASSGSLKPALVYTAFMLGYFLVVNLLRSKEWFMRGVFATVCSAAMVALYGLYQNFFGVFDQVWHDTDMFSEIEGRVVSTFENPNVLAEYLIMVIPLMTALFIVGKGPRMKVGGAFAIVVTVGCLVYTWSRGAWLGIIIGMLLFFLMYSKNTMALLLFGSVGIPFLPFILPSSITSRFLSIGNLGDSSTSYRVNIWRGVVNMAEDFWTSGIGVGNPPFAVVYPAYALSGIETAPHSHNLYLQILVELGVVGLAVFLTLLFINAQGGFEFHMKEKRREKLYSSAIFCGIIGVLAQGMTDYIWYNYRVFLMFWLILGLGVAIRKTMTATAPAEVF